MMHGGKSTGDKLLKAGGRHSKYLPQRLAARYEEACRDEELIAVKGEIALLDTRLFELIERLNSTETSAGWSAAWKLRRAEKQGGAEGARAALMLDAILEDGLKDTQTWLEIAGLVEQRRKLAETEQKRLAALDQFITAKQANVFLASVIKLVTDHVSDPDTRAKIGRGLAALSVSGEQPPTAGECGSLVN